MLGLYGGQDQGIPLADVEKMQAALSAANGRSTIHVYPDAPAFRRLPAELPQGRAEDGWKRALAHLGAALG